MSYSSVRRVSWQVGGLIGYTLYIFVVFRRMMQNLSDRLKAYRGQLHVSVLYCAWMYNMRTSYCSTLFFFLVITFVTFYSVTNGY